MAVSAGFQRKIEDWIIGEDWSVAFRPFLTNTNPYKAKIMLVGATAQPRVEADDVFIEALLNMEFFNHYYDFAEHNRENKGILAFATHLEQIAPTVVTSLNALMVNATTELKAQKGSTHDKRGATIFVETVAEFKPEVMILHGADAIKQFRKTFAADLVDEHPTVTKPQELEALGAFATWQLQNREIKVFACRTLSQYSNGKTFEALLQKIDAFLR